MKLPPCSRRLGSCAFQFVKAYQSIVFSRQRYRTSVGNSLQLPTRLHGNRTTMRWQVRCQKKSASCCSHFSCRIPLFRTVFVDKLQLSYHKNCLKSNRCSPKHNRFLVLQSMSKFNIEVGFVTNITSNVCRIF